jgi:medium-chain acyl-[acyl-carrier-protein] hydrolase
VPELPPELDQDVELWAVNLPGRESSLTARRFTDLRELVDALCSSFVPCLDAPYAFFGHSMGALIAFELARRLRIDAVIGPEHLVLSGFRAPHLPDRHPPVHHLDDEELLVRLKSLGGTPPEVLREPELMELMLPLLRADLSICETYSYIDDDPLPCSLTVFGGADDREVERDELAAWERHVDGRFALNVFPGGHFFLQSVQGLVLRILARDLHDVVLGLAVGGPLDKGGHTKLG